MKNYLIYYLLITLSIIVNSCSEGFKEEYLKFSIVLKEVTAITTPTTDTTPDYTFSSTESGAITYGDSCSSSTTIAVAGNNTITLNSLSDGTYSDCTITITNSSANSITMSISSFVIDTTAPTVTQETAVTTPTNDTTPNYTFSTNEAGTITYGGSCSSSTTSSITDNNTITLVSLSDGTYSNCTITVTDSAGNSVTLNISSFVIDTTAPTVSSISTTADNQGSVSITDNITVTFSEAMDTTYVTTNTSDTYCSGTIMVSSDNFSTCVKMSSSSPASSNSNKTFTLDPYDNLTVLTTYLVRVTTGVKDTAGNAMSSQYENSSPVTTKNLWGVTYGNGLFVTVGWNGTILTSSDGITWTERTSGTPIDLYGITSRNGLFVTVGESGTILTSPDGITWTERTSGTTKYLRGVTYSQKSPSSIISCE